MSALMHYAAMRDRASILLVEDDADVRDSTRMLLELEGYQVETAQNGLEALARLRAGLRPCLVLLDLDMPVMDGLTFRTYQLVDPQLAHIPVVVFSGHGDMLEDGAALFTGMPCLHKPVDYDALMYHVNRLCSSAAPEQN